jgi:hypothetical protein
VGMHGEFLAGLEDKSSADAEWPARPMRSPRENRLALLESLVLD